MAMTSIKSLAFKLQFKFQKAIWQPKYNTKQEIVKCNFTVSFFGGAIKDQKA
jgi:hypothetical protein